MTPDASPATTTAAGTDHAALHPLLARQLRRLGLPADGLEPAWVQLLQRVSAAYAQADDDRYLLERSIDISSREMRTLNDELQHQARHDSLTELPNRAALMHHLEAAVAECRSGERAAVVFIDLDRFKAVNDTLGHDAGDELLCQTAERLRNIVRFDDVVGRLGGDEFVVICRRTRSDDEVERLAGRIRDAIEQPFALRSGTGRVSASIGVALAGADGSTPASLMQRADLAMYRAKRDGRSRCSVFDDDLRTWAETRAEVEAHLGTAIRAGQLVVHYQPIVDIASGRVAGFESLVRWMRNGRLVPPGEFLPVAEENGLIHDIGRAVLDQSCRDLPSLDARTDSGGPACLAVNLSPRQLQREDLVPGVERTLRTHGVDPGCIVFELTEGALLTEDRTTVQALAALRSMGCRLAIDDFGTGWSSLGYLRTLAVDVLKVDRSFMTDVDTSDRATAIVGAIVQMAHALGLVVVAEGIERRSQFEVVKELGCDQAQGFALGRPAPIA
jgi:diguanylate cyclase